MKSINIEKNWKNKILTIKLEEKIIKDLNKKNKKIQIKDYLGELISKD